MSDDVDDGIATVSRSRGSAGASALRAVVVEGPDAGRAFDVDASAPSRVLLGTSPACAIRLTDPAISRRHLAFELSGRRYRVVDLDSTNGTTIDGVMIRDAYVIGGEILRCGGTAIRLEAVALAPASLHHAAGFGRLVGASPAMRRLYPLCERIAAATIPVILEGETGTGKETLAESVHAASGRPGSFVVLDCTAVSPSTVEVELFGCEEGAGLGPARQGVFEQADAGTLLIDEIAELSPSLQPKLLRALERGEVRRLGAARAVTLDVRVLVATKRDLDKEVAAGQFRDDLFHRLAGARIELPPLREREGDVRLLAAHFTRLFGAREPLSEDLLARFERDPWPGNVRELRNAVLRSITVGSSDAAADDRRRDSTLPPEPSSASWADDIVASGDPLPVARRRLVEEFERRYVKRVLAQYGGNVSQAALASGIALRYFQLVKARSR